MSKFFLLFRNINNSNEKSVIDLFNSKRSVSLCISHYSCFFTMCAFNPFWNFRLHPTTWHLNSKWTCLWSRRFDIKRKLWPQIEHAKFGPFSWVLMCVDNCPFSLYWRLQLGSPHLYGRMSKCMASWQDRALLWGALKVHLGQKHLCCIGSGKEGTGIPIFDS